MNKHGAGVGFARFVRAAAPFALLHLVLAAVYLLMRA